MTTNTKILLSVLFAAIATVAIRGNFYPIQQFLAATSPSGTTFGTAKFAGVAVNLASPGANGTSTSILNTDSGTRYITSLKAGCEGVGTSQTAYTGAGLSALTITAATTSTPAPAANGSASIGGGAFTLATATPQFTESTSTAAGGTSKTYPLWASGSYLTFTTNATNTAVCTFGADYFQS